VVQSLLPAHSLVTFFTPLEIEYLSELNEPIAPTVSLAFHPNAGGILAVGGRYGFVYLLDLKCLGSNRGLLFLL
jgi:hypothetical protein